ncbi:MAG: hypothetical protein HFF02_03170 [Erysipelotrichaceae bacterium]|nr:hypothetical protein [Erysipelotrichaceae bacterium]
MDPDNRHNDSELLYMIYQMDEESLGILMRKYLQDCERKMRRKMFYTEYSESGEDLMTDITLLLYESIYFFRTDKEAQFSTYFRHIFEYKMSNFFRKKQTYKYQCKSNMVSLDHFVLDVEGQKKAGVNFMVNKDMSLEGVHTARVLEIREILERYLKKEDQISRQIVTLRLQGWSFQDIARILNIDRRQAEYVMSKVRKHKPLIDYLKSL